MKLHRAQRPWQLAGDVAIVRPSGTAQERKSAAIAWQASLCQAEVVSPGAIRSQADILHALDHASRAHLPLIGPPSRANRLPAGLPAQCHSRSACPLRPTCRPPVDVFAG